MMRRIRVWDPLVRLFHWSLVGLFAANSLFVDDESRLHHWVGYAVLGLVAVRGLWGLVGSRHARFSDFPPSVSASLEQVSDLATGRTPLHVGHTPLGALMIYNLLLCLLVIGGSGWLMTTDAFWGVEWPEQVHEAAVLWAQICVGLHVAAVLWESRRTGINLPKAMVTGYKDVPHA
ncbi:cytochrome b/b6 domain-containing protein [Novispirillum itersonii]|uniref:Cytochrome b n=1 Tax=Novispirillum itersonii TaxID=189 RepID=A0A7W9ZCA4_NOVIT|nr:cytochrome b/b6 domain-containing protein [Novispirillum itersonii]MBB6208735.1 cytochrome b [Novispirillum itersonii]